MYEVTKRIGLDAGHRVPDHKSQCQKIHGHRYEVEVTLRAEKLFCSGEQKGMVMDFGFLKEVMLREIHRQCDHKFIIYRKDPLLKFLLDGPALEFLESRFPATTLENGDRTDLKLNVFSAGVPGVGLYVVGFVPTAENLAEHWLNRVQEHLDTHYAFETEVKVFSVKVQETPTSVAVYYNPECSVGKEV